MIAINDNIIKYIGFYDSRLFKNENRISFLSATNKMDYIVESLVKSNKKVEIISPSWTNNIHGYYPRRTIGLSNNTNLTCGPTFGSKVKLFRGMRVVLSYIWLFFYLVNKICQNETVIVYHSMMILKPVMLAKKIKKFKLILEVEEIYQDIAKFSNRKKRNEYKFFKMADMYIFSTELLNEKINVEKKPYSIISGTYHVEEDRKCKFNDGKIHVVYAGTFDPRKGGALAAAAAAAFLPQNYHVHIIGFGSKDDKNTLLKKIDVISKITEATLSYDGLLSGDEYIEFLQKCSIGLSTQVPEAAYNESSFPSKILSYMANGLRVVSIRIKAIEISEVGQAVYYYDKQDPEIIANAIKSIDINEPYDSREIIRKLDESFLTNIKKLLEG